LALDMEKIHRRSAWVSLAQADGAGWFTLKARNE
jgi:hypothetical protein